MYVSMGYNPLVSYMGKECSVGGSVCSAALTACISSTVYLSSALLHRECRWDAMKADTDSMCGDHEIASDDNLVVETA